MSDKPDEEHKGELSVPPIFRYKPRKLLEPDRRTLDRLTYFGGLHWSQRQMAAALGVSLSTFEAALREHPEMREAIEDGKQRGKATLKTVIWNNALAGDMKAALFLAKQPGILNMQDTPKTQVNVDASSKTVNVSVSAEEAKKRIMELGKKLGLASKPNTKQVMVLKPRSPKG